MMQYTSYDSVVEYQVFDFFFDPKNFLLNKPINDKSFKHGEEVSRKYCELRELIIW